MTNHHIVIGKDTNHIIWESFEHNDLSNYEIGLDVLLLINYKNKHERFSIPDNFLYIDYQIEETKESFYKFMKWNSEKNEYDPILNTESILTNNKKILKKKNEEIEIHVRNEYLILIDFSKKLIQEIKDSDSIKKLFEIANDESSYYSKAAKFILSESNNKKMNNEDLIKEYGCIKKTTNVLGTFITSLQKETEIFSQQLQGK